MVNPLQLLKMREILSEKYRSYLSVLNQPTTIIGIDIGTTSVKAAQMVCTSGEWTVLKTVRADISSDGKDLKAAAVGALKEALRDVDTQKAKIVCVVNCPQTCVRMITAPPMPLKELTEAIRWEVKNYIPFPLEEAVLDYEITGESVEKGVKKLNITVAAAPRGTIDNLLSFFSGLGLKVFAIIPVSAAFSNIIRHAKSAGEETLAVIELGASITELNIYRKRHLVFSRKLSLGGKDITQSLMTTLVSDRGKLELNFEQAEEIKRKYGMPEKGTDQLVDDKITTGQILSLMRPRLEQLAGDIESSLDFYREESHGGTVDQILLFGGGASLQGLVPFLNHHLGIRVEAGDALSPDLFHLAVGAAMQGGLSLEKNINLLPVEFKEETKRVVENVSVKAVMTAVIVAALLFYAGTRIQLSVADKKLQAAHMEYRGLQSQLGELSEKAQISPMVHANPAWGEVFKELSHVVPAGMHLTGIQMENNRIILKGVIGQIDEDTEVALSHLMLTLEKGLFKNVRLVKSQKRNSSSSEFEIACDME